MKLGMKNEIDSQISLYSILPKSLNFYPTALFRQSRFGYHTLQHISKPPRAYALPKGL
jgi:hypothetical protein